VLEQPRRLFLVAAYNISDLSDHHGDLATVLARVCLWRSSIQPIRKFPNGREITVLGLFGQLLGNPAKPKWIASESDPQRFIKWLFPIHAADRPSHNALRISFDMDVSLLQIQQRNYDCKDTALHRHREKPQVECSKVLSVR
jgi:hypothetical protein